MSIQARVLLICDDDLMSHELRKVIGGSLLIADVPATGSPLLVTLTYHELVLHGTWEMPVRGASYDMAIIALAGGTAAGSLRVNPLARDTVPVALYLVDPGLAADEAWLPRAGCADQVLTRPVETSELRARCIALLRTALAGRSTPDEQQVLTFLRERIAARQRTIAPAIRLDRAGATDYRDLSDRFGPECSPSAILESLVANGLATRTIVDRMRSCPGCSSTQLVFGEVCAACKSPAFTRQPMIHHFSCGHVDLTSRFTAANGSLTCPKCAKVLRQIGRDYERPVDCYCCDACTAMAAESRVVVRCLSCRRTCAPEATTERLIHAYELTARADEAVAAGSLSGTSLESVLAKRSGVCSIALFTFELERDLARHRRYGSPCALIMLRLDGLSALRSQGPDRYADHLERCCAAVTGQLRTIDLIAIWSPDTVAILLPETPVAGANVVADRMERGIAAVAPSDTQLRAQVAIAPSDSAFATGQAMVEACLASLQRPASTVIVDAQSLVTSDRGILPRSEDSAFPVVILEDDTRSLDASRQITR